jgi:hypothetical protein
MRKLLLLATCLAAGCGKGGEAPPNGGQGAAPAPPAAPVQTATLAGLYESPDSPPGQLCITEQGRAARFGLVTRRGGRPGCSGAGTATRAGGTLRLVMDGESACVIEARLDGASLTLPASMPAGCAYYCAPGATAAGAVFVKTGGAHADAQRARDLVGDRLCA